MKRLLSCLALAAASLVLSLPAAATVLTFDDITSDGTVAANYGGLDWSTGNWFAFGGDEAPYTPHSGTVRVTSGFDADDAATAIGLGAGRTFQGAWFAGLEGATVTFQLYDHGTLVATSATLDPSATPTWLASGYDGLVDEVIVSSPFQALYVMDDFTFSDAVPEPASIAQLLGGVLLLGAAARRRANTPR